MMVLLSNMCRELHSIPEIEKLKNLHLRHWNLLMKVNGQEVGGPTNATSSYDDMVAAFGQPVSSTDSANPGDGVNVLGNR